LGFWFPKLVNGLYSCLYSEMMMNQWWICD